MKLYDATDYGQAHTVSLGGMRFVSLIKLVEYLVQLFLRDISAAVGDGDHQEMVLTLYIDADDTAWRRKFHGIVQKVYPYLLHQLLVGFDHVLVQLQLRFQRFPAPFGFKEQYAGAKLLGQIVS